MKLFKDSIDASIELLNNDIYFDAAKSTLVFGNIDFRAMKSVKINRFEVRIIGESNEMFYEQYRLKYAKSDLLKKKFKTNRLLNESFQFDLTSVNAGTYKLPFEILINPQLETLRSDYIWTDYRIRLVIETENEKLVKYKPISLLRLISLMNMSHFGNFYTNLFNYQLTVPNKIFTNNDFGLQLVISPNNQVKNLKITKIEVFLLQNFKLNLHYYYINKCHKKECKSSRFFEVNRVKLSEFTPNGVRKNNNGLYGIRSNSSNPFGNGGNSDAASSFGEDSLEFNLELSLNKMLVDTNNECRLLHPSVSSSILECSHQLRFVVHLNNGEHAKFVHSVDVHNSDSINGSLAPPIYCSRSSDRSIDTTMLPPSYEVTV